jgi:hypothetical protein
VIPDASKILSSVGTAGGLACAKAATGAANSAEIAEARTSFFIADLSLGEERRRLISMARANFFIILVQ